MARGNDWGDDDAGQRRIPPSPLVQERRMRWANGCPPEQAVDTIGRMWCWGLLDGRDGWQSDYLRDAGRRYATLYWRRYGPVCAHTASFDEMVGGGGIRSIWIADPEADARFEESFRQRQIAVTNAGGRTALDLVDKACVDGHGDSDPKWLAGLMEGYPELTADERARVADKARLLDAAKGADAKRIAKRNHDDARRDLDRRLREIRRERLPIGRLSVLRVGLVALAEIDRAEGWHRRAPKPQSED